MKSSGQLTVDSGQFSSQQSSVCSLQSSILSAPIRGHSRLNSFVFFVVKSAVVSLFRIARWTLEAQSSKFRCSALRSLNSVLCSLISGFLSPVFCLLSSPVAQRSSLIPHPLPISDLPTPNSTPRFLTSDLWSLISAVFLSPSTQPSRVAQKSDEGGSLHSLRSSVFSLQSPVSSLRSLISALCSLFSDFLSPISCLRSSVFSLKSQVSGLLILFLILPLAAHAQYQVLFTQSSSPSGLITSNATIVTTGNAATTVAAPMSTSGYQFAYWTLNNVPRQDALGQSINPVTFTIALPTTAIANYVPAGVDTFGDGVPDWYKFQFFGSLTNAASDTDGDGWTLSDEYLRGYNPTIANSIIDGGISKRSSSLTPYISAGYVLYCETSSPAGLVYDQFILATGTVWVLPDVSAVGLTSGYQFGQWLTNNVRVSDALGRSVGGLPILITANMTNSIAVFYPTAQDTIGDGVSDWYKFQFYGSLTNAVSDTDGDGWTLLDEYSRGYNPTVSDAILDGGISKRGAALTSYVTAGYVLYCETSSPAGLVYNQYILATGTVWMLPDVSIVGFTSGYQFGQWLTNNVRVADALGRSVGGLPILVTTNMTNSIAVFFPMAQDTVGDGVPDWYKFQFYGSTNAVSDTDGDGWTLLDEYTRGYNPTVPDTILDGGISQRSGALTLVDGRQYVNYWLASVPNGVVNYSAQVPLGTAVNADIRSLAPGYGFGYWLVNGVRQQDTNGVALNPISFTIFDANTVAIVYLYTLTADSNGNGLPDWWEAYYFGSPTGADPNADNSGTGMNNLQKYLAGLNPLDPTSRLAITSVFPVPGGWEIDFPAVSGKVYRIEYLSDLRLSNTWQILQDNISTNGNATIQIIDSTATNSLQRFYRIGLNP